MIERKGSTLVELVMSMAAGSTVMLLAISLVHQTMMVSEVSKSRSDHHRTLDQLAQTFRRDLHVGESVTLADEKTLVILFPNSSTITYSVTGSTIVRQRKNGPDGNEFERFVLNPTSLVRMNLLSAPERARLVVESPTGTKDRPTKPELVIESIVGRWQTLEGIQGGTP